MKLSIDENVYLCCKDKKILFYCYYAGYVLNIKQLTYFESFKNIDYNNISIILQQDLIEEFINYKFKEKNKKIFIFLSNGHADYLAYKDKISELKNLGYNVSIITFENWFEYKDIHHYSLNNLSINKKNTLKKIYGVKFKTKLKFYIPFFTSIYNAILRIKFALPLLIFSKIVFVGRASWYEINETFDVYLKNKIINDDLHKKILNDLSQNNQKELFELINNNDFQNLNFIYQYAIYNQIIRFLLISHLNKFKNFYHKTNKLFHLELLKTNIYKKIFHIDLGVQVGNSFSDRTIYLERFFHKKYLRLNLFDANINYNSGDNFKNRLIKIENTLKIIYENKDFNLSFNEFKKWLIRINNEHLK